MPEAREAVVDPGVERVRRKLDQVVPYFVSAEALSRRPLYVAHAAYAYARDLLAGATGAGLGHPVVAALSGDAPQGLAAAVGTMPPWLGVVTVLSALSMAVLKVAVSRGDGEKRAALAASCRKEFRILGKRLRDELSSPNPLPGLAALQRDLGAIVDRHMAEDSWPWDGPKPGADVPTAARVDALVAAYAANWSAIPREPDVEQYS